MKYIKCEHNNERVNLGRVAYYYPMTDRSICFMISEKYNEYIIWKYESNIACDKMLQVIDYWVDGQEVDPLVLKSVELRSKKQ